VLGVLEDLLDLFGLVLLHEAEDLFRLLGGQLIDDVGGVLGGHLVEDARDLDLVEHPHQLEQRVVVELGDELARALPRQRAEDRDLIGERKLAQHGGEVGRVR